MNWNRFWTCGAYLVFSLAMLDDAAAQYPTGGVPPTWGVSASQHYQVPSDFKDRSGGMSSYDAGVRLQRGFNMRGVGRFEFGLGYTYTRFDFASNTELDFSSTSLFRDIHEPTLSVRFVTRVGPRLGVRVFGSVKSSMEEGAAFDDSVHGGIGVGTMYRISPSLSLGISLFVRVPLDGETRIFPFPFIKWDITDRLALTTNRGIALSYLLDPSRQIRISAMASYFGRKQFRLDDRGSVPGGIATISDISVGGRLEWQLFTRLIMQGDIGVVLKPNLTIEDQSGQDVVDEDLEQTLRMGLTVTYRF